MIMGLDGTAFEVLQSSIPSVTSRGTLVVPGSEDSERIIIDRHGGNVRVYLPDFPHGFATAFPASQVKRILVDARGGDDRVSVAGNVPDPCTLFGGAGNDILDANAASTMIGGGGNDKLVARHITPVFRDGAVSLSSEGRALLSGGDGKDTLVGGSFDTVIGGRGNDLAIYHYFLEPEDFHPRPSGEFLFADRASSTERFDRFDSVMPRVPAYIPLG